MNAKRILTAAMFVVALLSVAVSAPAQDEGFIYGKIHTYDGKTYQGAIRWEKEEVYWTDLFNASKRTNENLNYLTREEKEALHEDQDHDHFFTRFAFLRRFNIGNGSDSEYVHEFTCQFGDIKSLRPASFGKNVEVETQNGTRLTVNGNGYNDIGATITIMDTKFGTLDIDWHNIDKIEFENTPAHLSEKFGSPIFGSVETNQGTYTGYIQWDNDERLSTDKLDGEVDDKDRSIPFGSIASIQNRHSSSLVTLKSGEELEMHGSNDVNTGNRGILIYTREDLMIEVPWSEFKKLTFSKAPAFALKKYESFKAQKEINSTVITSGGKSLAGATILDLDEQYDFELFQGKSHRLEYSIPVRLISKITVMSRNSTQVELKNGTKIPLDSSQDAGEANQGVLVFNSSHDPVYIPWRNVNEIKMNP